MGNCCRFKRDIEKIEFLNELLEYVHDEILETKKEMQEAPEEQRELIKDYITILEKFKRSYSQIPEHRVKPSVPTLRDTIKNLKSCVIKEDNTKYKIYSNDMKIYLRQISSLCKY